MVSLLAFRGLVFFDFEVGSAGLPAFRDFNQDSGDESLQRVFAWEDSDDPGAAFDLVIEVLTAVGGAHFTPMI